MTPTIVCSTLPSRIVLPITPASPSNRSRHTSSPITSTGGAPGRSSLSRSVRPSSGATRATSKPAAVISATSIGSTSPVPAIRLRWTVRNAPRSTSDRSSRRQTAKSWSTRWSLYWRRGSRLTSETTRSPSCSGRSGKKYELKTAKAPALIATATAIPRPPTTASPGALASIRAPSRRSRVNRGAQASQRSSRTPSLAPSMPPKASRARRRASSAESPARRSFSVSISRWKASSSSSSRSTARRRTRARSRRDHRLVQLFARFMASRRPQDELDHVHVAPPLLRLRAEGPAPGARELVVLRPPPVLGGAPLALDPPLLLEPLEGRVERALADVQRVARELLDPLRDGPPVHGLERQRLEDQQVQRAADDVGLGGGGRGGAGAWPRAGGARGRPAAGRGGPRACCAPGETAWGTGGPGGPGGGRVGGGGGGGGRGGGGMTAPSVVSASDTIVIGRVS